MREGVREWFTHPEESRLLLLAHLSDLPSASDDAYGRQAVVLPTIAALNMIKALTVPAKPMRARKTSDHDQPVPQTIKSPTSSSTSEAASSHVGKRAVILKRGSVYSTYDELARALGVFDRGYRNGRSGADIADGDEGEVIGHVMGFKSIDAYAVRLDRSGGVFCFETSGVSLMPGGAGGRAVVIKSGQLYDTHDALALALGLTNRGWVSGFEDIRDGDEAEVLGHVSAPCRAYGLRLTRNGGVVCVGEAGVRLLPSEPAAKSALAKKGRSQSTSLKDPPTTKQSKAAATTPFEFDMELVRKALHISDVTPTSLKLGVPGGSGAPRVSSFFVHLCMRACLFLRARVVHTVLLGCSRCTAVGS